MEEKPPLKLDRDTLIPLGLLTAVVVAAITMTSWLQGTLLGLDSKIELLSQRIGQLQSVVDNRWTAADMHAWVELLAARNSALSIPPVPHKE